MAHHPRAPHTAFDIVCPSKVLPMEKPPSLSIVLSTRNHMKFLPECLQGILTQTFTDFEFLIVDDGSTDDTWSCLESCAQKDSRIRLFRNQHPLGVIKSYNQLFRLAQGSHIWSVATDDHCINPGFLNDGFRLLHRFPHAAGFYANMRIVKMPGEVFERNWATESQDRFFKPNEIMSLFWKDSGYPCGPSIVLRKTWYERFHGWPTDLGPQTDCFLNVVAGGNAGMVYLGKPSVVHRIWQDGTSFTSSQAKKDLFRCLARMESLLRLNLPAHPNDNSSWERWRVDAILRVLNTKYEYKILLKKRRRSFFHFWISIIRDLRHGVSLYCSALSPSFNGSRNSSLKLKERQIAFTRRIWNHVKIDYQLRLVTRLFRSLQKRLFASR